MRFKDLSHLIVGRKGHVMLDAETIAKLNTLIPAAHEVSAHLHHFEEEHKRLMEALRECERVRGAALRRMLDLRREVAEVMALNTAELNVSMLTIAASDTDQEYRAWLADRKEANVRWREFA
jgi:hypothetical protein